MSLLNQIENVFIIREYNKEGELDYDMRCNKNNEEYHFNRYEVMMTKYIDKYIDNPNIICDENMYGFWKYSIKFQLKRIIFFRPNNCSCGHSKKSVCPHERLYRIITWIMSNKGVHTDGIGMNVIKFL